MQKIKVSELPLVTSLKGLFTLGKDAYNNSVQVSLEFVEEKTDEAAGKATEAADAANEAAQTANDAVTNVLAAIGRLIPTGLTVEYIERITEGNLADNRIKAVLTPAGTLENIIYISDNKAVTVAPDGRITVVAKGRSTVHVIPTCNTALAKTVQIEVTGPTLRLASRTALRLTQAGGLRLD